METELDAKALKIEIEKQRGQSPYSYWTIGITDDPVRRRDEHEAEGKNTKYWHCWKAYTEQMARDTEEMFIERGMVECAGGGKSPKYVYIF